MIRHFVFAFFRNGENKWEYLIQISICILEGLAFT